MRPGFETVLTVDALEFVGWLTARHGPRRDALLQERRRRRAEWAAGKPLDLLDSTRDVREADWRVAPLPAALVRRIVEITGPVDRKMIINALNSGADTFMADFEDSSAPTWEAMVGGQIHLRDAAGGEMAHQDPSSGKLYNLSETPATLLVRPRGLHLPEAHCLVDDEPVPGALFDFALFMFHSARRLIRRGAGPYFYLPKLESHLEARWWNDVFLDAQARLELPRGTIKATVLIETLPAAFEMDEILHELREHSAGLNCGRWDYIFSLIKTLRHDARAVLPDRSQVGMEQPCMRAYSQLLIKTCHRRGVHAIGGMAAQIPVKNDPQAQAEAMSKVRADKLREVTDGHDGTWVAHPGLVQPVREIFESQMKGDNQLDRDRADVTFDAPALLEIPRGTRTEEGLRLNVRVGIHYLESWLCGTGCVPLYHLMEDAATAEISRAQVWQWLAHRAPLEDGRVVDRELVGGIVDEEMRRIAGEVGEPRFRDGRFQEARLLFEQLCYSDDLAEFLTLVAYEHLESFSDA